MIQFLRALTKEQEEQQLFQFLNGIDDVYGPQRSKILLMNPVPNTEIAYTFFQQEELQEEVLDVNKIIADQQPCYLKCQMRSTVSVKTKDTTSPNASL